MTKRLFTWSALAVLLLVASCTATPVASEIGSAKLATPTSFAFFKPVSGMTPEPPALIDTSSLPTIAALFVENPTRAVATAVPVSRLRDVAPLPTPLPAEPIDLVAVFDDGLGTGWALIPDRAMELREESGSRAHSGSSYLELTPAEDFAAATFGVAPDGNAYRREDVVGVSLWLNSGDQTVQPDDVAVAVVGSNDNRFWVPNDDSVTINQDSFFSETRLYYMGINRAIPPNTWVELVVNLDDLPYDPDYTYVTGLYVKTDEDFRQTIYLDDINLIVLSGATAVAAATTELPPPGDSPEGPATPVPSATVTPTTTPEQNDIACIPRQPVGWVSHEVASGDTVSGLAFGSQVSIEEFMAINCLSETTLPLGKQLLIWQSP